MASKTLINASSIPPSGRSGRWIPSSSSEGLITSWCSASLEFLFSGTKLVLAVGGETERKDPDNGGTKMITVITGKTKEEAFKMDLSGWRNFDLEAGGEIVIFDGEEGGGGRHEGTYVRVVLIDWASKFEIKGFVVDESGYIEPVSKAIKQDETAQIVVVGDSISSGLAVDVEKGGEPLPFGCLNTFPFVAQRVLRGSMSRAVDVELIGYPGFSLVHPTEKEKEEGYPHGMQEAFFWESPWSSGRSTHVSSPTTVLIELGTNDQSFAIPAERFGKALIAFVDALQKWSHNSIRNIWLVPPFPDADVPDYKEIKIAMPSYVDTLTKSFGDGIDFKICDLVDGLTTEDTVDGVHPPLRVHNEIGRKLAEFIERNLFE